MMGVALADGSVQSPVTARLVEMVCPVTVCARGAAGNVSHLASPSGSLARARRILPSAVTYATTRNLTPCLL